MGINDRVDRAYLILERTGCLARRYVYLCEYSEYKVGVRAKINGCIGRVLFRDVRDVWEVG